ncbi:O-antigen ligase family protein [Lacisediminimonas sp.]|uniref:O-antigen ligase family protein n=1 Tax=Lacisediminimonas sp. TaxID=3060582 RepID=UPI00271A9B0D|nr:O-antigen ligase family protein [Lacisediminimonas sp.]MDO8300771.1 hypothetical protein [Lacisediminimonas sp.]
MAADPGLTAAHPALPHRGSALVMTDYGFLLALALALWIAVDPLEADLERRLAIKHLPMLLLLPFLLLSLVGAKVFHWQEQRPSMRQALLPLLLLAGFIIGGGVFARFASGIQNSFLVAGVYMLAAPAAAALLIRSGKPVSLLNTFAWLVGAMAVVVFAGLVVNYNVRQVYHELEFLFPPLAVLIGFAVPRGWKRWAGMAFFILMALAYKKNTGYLVGLLVIAYLLAFEAWPRWSQGDTLKKLSKAQWTLIAAAALAGLVIFLLANRAEYLPSGNPQFRLFTYERAWARFLASPLWGTGFAAPAAEKFTVFDTGVSDNVLPTHSDVLDIFAHGGLLGVMLWLWMLLRLARLAWLHALHPRHRQHPLAPYAHWLACMSIAGVLVYAFNPIILQPAKSLLLWGSLGLLGAIAACMRSQADQQGTP